MAITEDERLAKKMQQEVATSMAVGLIPAVDSLARRAGRGQDVRAIKLLLEATGVHNPRISHEHSGEIRIKFDIPRPRFEDEETITDATVVDEND